MKSPITGKEMSIQREERTIEFRKESFPVVFHYYLCNDSGEQFTTTALDELNMNQVYNQYRDLHNLPFPEEIKAIREKYDLPATKMSEILGFGVNSYRQYEGGEVPANANGKLIQLAADPIKFRQLVEIAESLDELYREKLLTRIDDIILKNKKHIFETSLEDYFFYEKVSVEKMAGEYSGYRKPNLEKLTEMVVYITERMQPWKTQMNKLLFYVDFLNFKRTCYSMSGGLYRAIDMGPVINNYNSIFDHIAINNNIDIFSTEFPTGAIGDQFKPRSERSCKIEVFSDSELSVLDEVIEKFRKLKTTELVEISHKEKAWLENIGDKKIISYKYAFDLSQI